VGILAVLFVIGFGLITLLRAGSGAGDAAASAVAASASGSAVPGPCQTTMVSPAETLPQSSKVRINVYNATSRVGLAGDTAKVLSARGFKIQAVANDPLKSAINGVGEIRYGKKGELSAQLVEFYLPGANLVNDGRNSRVVDVVLGDKFKKLEGEGQIAAAMASPRPSLSGPGCPTSEP
jgi:hypothetical protein